MTVNARPAKVTELSILKEIFADTYAHNPRLQEDSFLLWQYFDVPGRPDNLERDELCIWLIEKDEDIAAIIASIPFMLHAHGKTIEAAWLQQWVNRTGGISGLQALMEMRNEARLCFAMGFTEDAASVYQRLSFPILDAMSRYVAFPSGHQAEQVLDLTFSNEERSIIERSRSALLIGDMAPAQRESGVEEGFDYVFGSDSGVRIWPKRNSAYLNWRYRDCPKHDYRFLRAEDALMVYRLEPIMDRDAWVVRIVEICAARCQLPALVNGLMEDEIAAGAVIWDFYCTAATYYEMLSDAGFVAESKLSVPVPDLFRPTYRSPGLALAFEGMKGVSGGPDFWDDTYFSRGDADIDRVKL